MDEGRLVYRWVNNSRDELRATLKTYSGRRIGDVRIWTADENDVDHPTKKGIALQVKDLPRLREAVDALLAEAECDTKADTQ